MYSKFNRAFLRGQIALPAARSRTGRVWGKGGPRSSFSGPLAPRVRGEAVPGTACVGKAERGTTESEGRAGGRRTGSPPCGKGRAGMGGGGAPGRARSSATGAPSGPRSEPRALRQRLRAQWKGERGRSEAGGGGGCMSREVLPRRSAAGKPRVAEGRGMAGPRGGSGAAGAPRCCSAPLSRRRRADS